MKPALAGQGFEVGHCSCKCAENAGDQKAADQGYGDDDAKPLDWPEALDAAGGKLWSAMQAASDRISRSISSPLRNFA